MFAFGLPFVPAGLFLFILNNADRFFIQKFLDSSTLGVYSFGYKLGAAVSLFILGPFLRVWGPYMFKLDKSGSKHLFGRYFLYVTAAYCVAGVWFVLFAREALALISTCDYWPAHQVIPWIVGANLFWTAAAFFDSGFYITEKTVYKPFIMGAAALLIVILYAFLIPRYGMMGGAYATFIAFAFFSVLTYIASQKVYPLRYPIGRFLVMGFLGATACFASESLPLTSAYAVLAWKCVLAVGFPLCLIVLGIIKQEDLSALFAYGAQLKRRFFQRQQEAASAGKYQAQHY